MDTAIAVPKIAKSNALPSALQRGHNPAIRSTPSTNSATVAAHARNGIVEAGMKELT